VAGLQGQPGLAVSGSSDGALTLWRRGDELGPPQALATFTTDLDGSLRSADGRFLGWLLADNRALFDPDWLRSTSASLKQGAAELSGIPNAQAQVDEEPARRPGPGGRELNPVEEILLNRFNQAIKQLREIDPNNREGTYTGPSYVPDEPTVLRVETAVHEARIKAVIAETVSAKGDIQSEIRLTEAEGIDAGLKFVGPGYREIGKPGDGVFRSLDGTRQFRIDSRSLEGRHRPFAPHISFETIDPITGKVLANNHVLIISDVRSR
jgi:hypothetical protein